MPKTNTSRSYGAMPHDDRWHYFDFPDDANRSKYIEWKYFNFTQKDLEGYIMYYILDPDGNKKNSGARLLIRILKDGNTYGLVKKIAVADVDIDPVSASIRMGGARIIEQDSHHYKLLSEFSDMSWELDYKQVVPSIESYQNIHIGIARFERINWLIKMPKARVTGNIRIGESNFQIDGLGYSDTNWGEILPFFSTHEWGQYNDNSFSLVFGILRGLVKTKCTCCYVILDKKVISLEKGEHTITHLEWVTDTDTGRKIPSKSKLFFTDGEYTVEFETTLIHHDTPGVTVHPVLPKIFVSEQIVHYKGDIKKDGNILRSFEGKGFQEWGGKTWKKIPESF